MLLIDSLENNDPRLAGFGDAHPHLLLLDCMPRQGMIGQQHCQGIFLADRPGIHRLVNAIHQ